MSTKIRLIGTVWSSRDKRDNRRVRVMRESAAYVYVVPVDARGLNIPGGKETRIRKAARGGVARYARVNSSKEEADG